jgi:hypothetical protein
MMSGAGAITTPRYDETLYSTMARASRYLGSPRPRLLHEALFGADLPVFDDLPVGLNRVIAADIFGPAKFDDAVHGWTLFPYYSHYVLPSRAVAAVQAMAGVGQWPHEALRSWTSAAEPPLSLRFCLSCREDMREQYPDLWWRRAHQLPSALVCPDHGEMLRETGVLRDERRRRYVPATLDLCDFGRPQIREGLEPRVTNDLVALARMSAALLGRQRDSHPDNRRDSYLSRLERLDLLNRAAEAKLPALAMALDQFWGNTLDLWPRLRSNGRCAQKWLGTLLRGEHESPPLHHLLLEGMLAARVAPQSIS